MAHCIIVIEDILKLSAEELTYVPKVILLKKFGHYVEHLWNKLPEHIKADPEVQGYRRCDEHYNQPWQRPGSICKRLHAVQVKYQLTIFLHIFCTI